MKQAAKLQAGLRCRFGQQPAWSMVWPDKTGRAGGGVPNAADTFGAVLQTACGGGLTEKHKNHRLSAWLPKNPL
ncbi:hypothetical protein D0T90_05120 [Neisseria animalis]|uniref:Uncharacterized protein n=1 Tax=Neisseria animalis TaxID=492 RepID=A0A5P3MS76_NEIAN|nr:hypothetical protein D0T90_05120 [Neisseria animalis]